MKAIIQRVSSASVAVENHIVGAIERGFLVLLGVAAGDSEKDVSYLADKICNLRIFANSEGKFDRSLLDGEGEVLLVSQFTLLADCSKGRRPNFQQAAKPDEAKRLYEAMAKAIEQLGIRCALGQFQADMKVSLVNDGPVTIVMDSK